MSRTRVDCLLRNGRIQTVDAAMEVAGAMAIHDGRIVDVGPPEDLARRWEPAREVDAGGMWVCPGFIDAHSHLLNYAGTLGMADLRGCRSWDEAVDCLREHQRRHPAPWARGRGWDQNRWPGQAFPTLERLDQAFPHQPAYLARIDMHAAMANSAALARAGVDGRTRVDGGLLATAQGRLTGLLVDNAMQLVERAIPAPDRAAREELLLEAQRHCFSVGLTSVADAGLDRDDVLFLESMHQDGRLKLRVYAMLNPTRENYEQFVDRGVHLTGRLTVRAIKTFSDGALGSRGALLLEPYSDDPGNRGLQLHPPEWFDAICARAARAGYQANTHAIGDAAVRLVLGIYERHLEPGNDLRWRIEHAEIVRPEDMPRFGARGIIPSIQTSHATSDMKWAAGRLGPRIRRAFCNKELLAQNGWLPNGSDFPVERPDPLLGFYAGVVRKDAQGDPEGGFQMENALTREETLRSMTVWAARGNFEEDNRGSLEPGKWADFVILDRDLLQAPESELLDARVLATYSAGELVYQRE